MPGGRIYGIQDSVAFGGRAAGYGACMALEAGNHKIGPDTGHLHVRTAREGVASRVGHDLLIAFQRWSGTITSGGNDPTEAQIEVHIELDSFEILDGTGGVVALTADNRKDITATAHRLLEVDQHGQASFASSRIKASEDGGTIEGNLTLRGRSAPVTVEVTETGPSAWHGSTTLLQSAFGIKPYRAFLGTLRLADAAQIEVTVDLAGK